MFYYLFGWEMIHLHTEGSCPVVSGQGVCDYDQFWSLTGRVAQCCGSYAQFFVLLCNTPLERSQMIVNTSKEPVCPRVELILKINYIANYISRIY